MSPETARAIVVLSEEEHKAPEDADARTLRVLLAVVQAIQFSESKPASPKGHMVVELSDPSNQELVELVGGVHMYGAVWMTQPLNRVWWRSSSRTMSLVE